MEYMYACMLLHKAGKEINEANIKKVLESAGVKVDEAKIKAVVAALEGVDIEKTIAEASVPMAVAPAAGGEVKEEKKDNKKSEEDEKKAEEQAAAGLGSLFG